MKNIKRRGFIKNAVITGLVTAVKMPTALANSSKHNRQALAENEKKLTFLFQGDSITDGNRGRNNDPNHIMGHGYAFSIASRIGADFPEAGFTFYNRGISGNKVTDLENRWQTDTLDLKPDVLSILIGINDVNEIVNQEPNALIDGEFENKYRSLLQQARQINPDVIFVLGLPFVYELGKPKENWSAWRDETAKLVAEVRTLVTEFNAVVVDYPVIINKVMAKATPDYWIWDGIHPTIFTHEIMAREWIKQVSARLKFLRVYKYA